MTEGAAPYYHPTQDQTDMTARVVIDWSPFTEDNMAVAVLEVHRAGWPEDHWEPVAFAQLSITDLTELGSASLTYIRSTLKEQALRLAYCGVFQPGNTISRSN